MMPLWHLGRARPPRLHSPPQGSLERPCSRRLLCCSCGFAGSPMRGEDHGGTPCESTRDWSRACTGRRLTKGSCRPSLDSSLGGLIPVEFEEQLRGEGRTGFRLRPAGIPPLDLLGGWHLGPAETRASAGTKAAGIHIEADISAFPSPGPDPSLLDRLKRNIPHQNLR
jgi:hypothetical protein